MPIRRLPTNPWNLPARCRHPEHNVPNMISLQPGTYEHTCPGCGAKTIFTVSGPQMRCTASSAVPHRIQQTFGKHSSASWGILR